MNPRHIVPLSFLRATLTVFTIVTVYFSVSVSADEGSCKAYTILGKPTDYTQSSTGVKLAVRRWIPQDGNVSSVIVFHHGGAGWHSGYADIMGRSMQSAGISVIAYDQVGSGYSDGMNGLRGYFDSMETLSGDFTKILKDVKAEFPNQKVFAMGESFGCMVLLEHILIEQEKNKENVTLADGYILTGPVVKILREMLPPKLVIRILNFVARFFPMLKMPGTDFFSTFDLAFGDKGWAEAGRSDPMIQEAAAIPPRLGMAASLLTTMDKIYDSLEEVKVPFKIFIGEHEERVDVEAVKRLAKVAKSQDKEMEIVKDGHHQLFQDVQEVTKLVCHHIQQWILDRI